MLLCRCHSQLVEPTVDQSPTNRGKVRRKTPEGFAPVLTCLSERRSLASTVVYRLAPVSTDFSLAPGSFALVRWAPKRETIGQDSETHITTQRLKQFLSFWQTSFSRVSSAFPVHHRLCPPGTLVTYPSYPFRKLVGVVTEPFGTRCLAGLGSE